MRSQAELGTRSTTRWQFHLFFAILILPTHNVPSALPPLPQRLRRLFNFEGTHAWSVAFLLYCCLS